METWAQLLLKYGPIGLFLFFVYVIEKKARATLRDKEIPRRISVATYAVAWVAILGLAGATLYWWFRVNLDEHVILCGTFENLQAQETVTSRREDLYFRRVYDKPETFDYRWCVIAGKPLDGQTVRFVFDRGLPNEKSATAHEFKIQPDHQNQELRIVYQRRADKVVFRAGGKEEELRPADELDARAPPPRLDLVPTAYAQGPPAQQSIDSALRRLEVNDPIIRQDARVQLGKMGRQALPGIDKALQDPAGSYRVRVGAISALNRMQGLNPDALSKPAYTAIVRAAGDRDPSLAIEAFRFFSKYSVAGSASLPASGGGSPEIRVLNTLKPDEGDFRFLFTVAPPAGSGVDLRLNEVLCFQDGSAAATSWLFTVFLNEREAFRLPARSYTDAQRPTRYRMTASDRARATVEVPPGKGYQVRVIGYKPKNVVP